MRLPLSAKILIWFFLNLLVLAAVVILIFNAQFRFDLDWVFATSAQQRVDALRALVVGELNTTPPDEWDRVLERFSDAYHVRLSLFEANGDHLIGGITDVPQAVRERMLPARHPNELPPSDAKPAIKSPDSLDPTGGGRTFPKRSFIRTKSPTQYWLLLHAHVDNPQAGNPMHVILVAESDSLSAGGLILDPAPWLILAIGGGGLFGPLLAASASRHCPEHQGNERYHAPDCRGAV